MATAGGFALIVIGGVFVAFGAYGHYLAKRGRVLFSQAGGDLPYDPDWGISPPGPAQITGYQTTSELRPVGSPANSLMIIVGAIMIFVGILLVVWGQINPLRENEPMYPFNRGTAFPAHTEPGVLRTEIIGNLL